MDDKVMGWVDLIITSFIGWVNKGFEFLGLYSTKYAGWIVAALIVWIAAKIFRVRLNLGGGSRG